MDRCFREQKSQDISNAIADALGAATRVSFQGFNFGIPGGIDMALILRSAVVSPVSRIVKRSVSFVSGFFAVSSKPSPFRVASVMTSVDLGVTDALDFARIVELQIVRAR